MSKNSTKKFLDLLLKEKDYSFGKSIFNISQKTDVGPSQETIDNVLAYAYSVKAIRIKSNDKVLISLN